MGVQTISSGAIYVSPQKPTPPAKSFPRGLLQPPTPTGTRIYSQISDIYPHPGVCLCRTAQLRDLISRVADMRHRLGNEGVYDEL